LWHNFQVQEVRHSVCALDCPDACCLLVRVEEGRATRLRGNPEHPITRGFLCAKVSRYLERVYSPERLLYPHKRTGAKGEGRFARISWEEALDSIAARLSAILEELGGEAILPYSCGGTLGYLNGAGMDRRFFHRLGASRLARNICSGAGNAALEEALGVRYGTEPEQFREARLILAWGANILGASVHLWPFIVEARRQGARFYTIDPVRNRTGSLADRHFFINPGSDAALALGMMHVIVAEELYDRDYLARYTLGFEGLRERLRQYPPERVSALTGLSVQEIVELAREYATTQPAVIRLNYGMQHNERGGLAVRAISLLPVLTGAWRRRGGGLLFVTSGAFQLNRSGLERPDLGPPTRILNMAELGHALTQLDHPRVQALIVYNSNPAAIAPNQNLVLKGLRRPDLFTVVLEQFQTDTADHADILLPVTTFLEHTDLYYAYGHYYLQLARPALDPPGEARSNLEIFRLLAQRMGFDEACFQDSEDQMIRTLVDSPHRFIRGITLEELEEKKFVRLRVAPEGESFLPFATGGFGTPSGKCDFAALALDYAPPVESRWGSADLRARYPLELVSPKSDQGMNSTFGYRPEVDQEAAALGMHPRDALPRGIASGDAVRVFNDRGNCRLVAQVDSALREGVVRASAVRWNKKAPDRRNVNVLTSDRLTDIGGGGTFYSCLVEVEKCAD
jgi:anaerobic selenocysteine-containing dehydrogenase